MKSSDTATADSSSPASLLASKRALRCSRLRSSDARQLFAVRSNWPSGCRDVHCGGGGARGCGECVSGRNRANHWQPGGARSGGRRLRRLLEHHHHHPFGRAPSGRISAAPPPSLSAATGRSGASRRERTSAGRRRPAPRSSPARGMTRPDRRGGCRLGAAAGQRRPVVGARAGGGAQARPSGQLPRAARSPPSAAAHLRADGRLVAAGGRRLGTGQWRVGRAAPGRLGRRPAAGAAPVPAERRAAPETWRPSYQRHEAGAERQVGGKKTRGAEVQWAGGRRAAVFLPEFRNFVCFRDGTFLEIR